MSRYRLQLQPQKERPRDLALGVRLAREEPGESVFVVGECPKALLLGPLAGTMGGGNGRPLNDDNTYLFSVVTAILLDAPLSIQVSSSDVTLFTVDAVVEMAGDGTAHGAVNFRVTFTGRGGRGTLTVSASGYASDSVALLVNPLAVGQDTFANAQAIKANALIGDPYYELPHVNNAEASRETGEPVHIATGARSLWWKITPTASGLITIDLTASIAALTNSPAGGNRLDTVLCIYTGSVVNALTLIASNDDFGSDWRSKLSNIALSAGITYRICVAMRNTTQSGIIVPRYTLAVPSQ